MVLQEQDSSAVRLQWLWSAVAAEAGVAEAVEDLFQVSYSQESVTDAEDDAGFCIDIHEFLNLESDGDPGPFGIQVIPLGEDYECAASRLRCLFEALLPRLQDVSCRMQSLHREPTAKVLYA